MGLEEAVTGLFDGDEVVEVPTVDERYRYKKRGGSSDTKNTSDEFD